jgi:hypothetical protein
MRSAQLEVVLTSPKPLQSHEFETYYLPQKHGLGSFIFQFSQELF